VPKWLKLALLGIAVSQAAYWGLKLANPYLTRDDYYEMLMVLLAVAFVGLMVAMFGGKGPAR